MEHTLRALVERIVPANDGLADFVTTMIAADGDARDLAPLVRGGLARLDPEAAARHSVGATFAALPGGDRDAIIADLLAAATRADWGDVTPDAFARAVIRLCAQGHYSDPVTWPTVGYRPLPDGVRWPAIDDAPPPVVAWHRVRDRYDAIVVGAGAGGGVAACVLAEAGLRVLVVERGAWLTAADLIPDHLRNQRIHVGVSGDYDTPAGPPAQGNPRVFGDEVVWPSDPRWSNTAMTVGGGTRVFGAQAWRFCAEDFAMATTYGVPDGSSLADWPITYDDLEPWYDRVEWELGVSGDPAGNAFAGRRNRGYPMPPVRPNGVVAPLARGAAALGLGTSPVPLFINSVPYLGRGACVGCGTCVGFGCPGEFKNDTRNTVLPRAVATGRCDVLTATLVERITVTASGQVTGVALRSARYGHREIAADRVLVGAGAVETARLLLNSTSQREPDGLGNNHDQVGRHLQGHVYAGAFALFAEGVQDCVGPGPSIATNDFRHHNAGIVGGGMLANDFVPTPLQAYGSLTALGLVPRWGAASAQGLRDRYRRLAMVTGPVQEVPTAAARVTVDGRIRDGFGIPVARLTGSLHPEDGRAAAFLADRAADWLAASGAAEVFRHGVFRVGPGGRVGPSGGQHQAGTCRMGTDPAFSVTDSHGRVWGHDNLYLVDGSVHVTNGGVNPVLTILALAYRTASHVAAS